MTSITHKHKYAFLICSERSGSNFITKILDSHPDISGPSPIHLLRFFVPIEHLYGDFNQDNNWEIFINDIVEFYNKKISLWTYEVNPNDFIAIKNRSLAECFKLLYIKEAHQCSKNFSFVKENHAYRLLPYYLINFKEAKFIWSFRDPRDMALSWKQDAILRGGIVRAANIWKEDQKNSYYFFNSLKFSGKILKISYEELTRNTEIESRRICNFLEVNYSNAMVDLANTKSAINNAYASVGWSNLNKGILKDNSKKYLNELNEKEIKFIEYLCYEEMLELGYQPEFPKIDRLTFIKIQYELSLEEKYEKEAYLSVPETEKTKRKAWTECLNRIQNQFK